MAQLLERGPSSTSPDNDDSDSYAETTRPPEVEFRVTPEQLENITALHVNLTEAKQLLQAEPSLDFKELVERKDYKTIVELLVTHVDTWKDLQPLLIEHEAEIDEIGWEH